MENKYINYIYYYFLHYQNPLLPTPYPYLYPPIPTPTTYLYSSALPATSLPPYPPIHLTTRVFPWSRKNL